MFFLSVGNVLKGDNKASNNSLRKQELPNLKSLAHLSCFKYVLNEEKSLINIILCPLVFC